MDTQRDGARQLLGRRLGRYEILARLAAGGMAEVYVARAHGVAGFERLVALKVLHANLAHEEEFISMFLDEARLAARIRHPNVVPTLDISDTVDAGYYLVMDYIEGDHLGALLASAFKHGEPLHPRVVLRIVSDALGGLGAAHDLADDSGKCLNLVHRDVSPHNIMVGVDGVSRLTDFGVAKAEDRLTHTREGQVKGKLAYMAPEQASQGTADPRSDLFSMGIILWESLTGQRLFRGETTAATLHKLLSEPIPKPSSIRPDLEPFDKLFDKALAREITERYQNADEFIEALEESAAQVGGLASLRKVGKAVRFYAEEKIQRDKQMISEAIRVLGIADKDGAHPSLAPYVGITEPSAPSQVSSSGSSGHSHSSLSAASGSRRTQPNVPRRTTNTGRFAPPPPPRQALAARGPNMGSDDERSGLSSSAVHLPFDAPPAGAARRMAMLAVGAVALIGAAVWAFASREVENVQATAIDSPDPATAAPAEPPVVQPTSPPVVEPSVASPGGVVPEPAPSAAPPETAGSKSPPAASGKPQDDPAPSASGGKRPPRTGDPVSSGTTSSSSTPSTPPTTPPATSPAPPTTPRPAGGSDFPALNPYR